MRFTRDAIGGLFLIAVSILFIIIAAQYQFGTLLRMGAGLYPILVAGILGLLGVALFVSGLRADPESQEKGEALQVRSTLAVLGSVTVFALTLERFGLIISTFLLVAIAAFAETKPRLLRSLVVAACLAVLAVGIFSFGLRLNIPILRMPS